MAGPGHGPARGPGHPADCTCTRCTGFQPGHTLSLKHGATSERQIIPRATIERRRLLRQIGMRQDDLESVGRALLLNWSRAAAALHLLDEYAQRNGWLDEEGEPRGFAGLYVRMLNSERAALKAFSQHLRTREVDPFDRLNDYLIENFGDRDGDG